MLNTDQTIQATTNPPVPCMLAGQDRKARVSQVETTRALHTLREARANADGPWAGILDIVLDAITEGADPAAVTERVLELFAQVRAEAGAL